MTYFKLVRNKSELRQYCFLLLFNFVLPDKPTLRMTDGDVPGRGGGGGGGIGTHSTIVDKRDVIH